MKKLLCWFVLMMTLAVGVGGCCSKEPGSRQFIPGKGWVPA